MPLESLDIFDIKKRISYAKNEVDITAAWYRYNSQPANQGLKPVIIMNIEEF